MVTNAYFRDQRDRFPIERVPRLGRESLPAFLRDSPFTRQNRAFLPPEYVSRPSPFLPGPSLGYGIDDPIMEQPVLRRPEGGSYTTQPDVPDFLRPTGANGDAPDGGPEILPPPDGGDDDGELEFGSFLESDVEGQRAAFEAFLAPFATTSGRKKALGGLFRDVRNEFLGELGTLVLNDGAPTLKFADFLKDQPLAKRLLQQANAFEGQTKRQLAPQTRTLFGF